MAKLLGEILKQKQEQLEGSEFERVEVRQEWIANCERLMSRITEWLQPFEDKNWLETQSEKIPIREDQLGDYEVQALRLIFLDGQILTFKPVGRFIIRAQGRVDVVSGSSGSTLLVMLLHIENDEWEFARRERRYEKHEKPVRRWKFNKSALEEFLAEFLEE